jgi:hypothetical protein
MLWRELVRIQTEMVALKILRGLEKAGEEGDYDQGKKMGCVD